ncbi:diacylglycerol kinase family protein [Natranaerobius trueperi]|uniref:Diacylglycerol kinase n=1 Tax=Natranaerobius trueperi TaxID=759412 RepID=A0A226BXK2_9FIRM|nr:diacylglycerol kinase family protein [Natranaerobius trueperi]OWZ83064.1 diacylglycerol kinase [Natranaerobius trueperi]
MKRRNLLDSFRYALKGIFYTVLTQPNMRYHIIAALLVLIIGHIIGIDLLERLLVTLSIFLVLITEMINTAIESTVDLYTKKQRQLAAIAKDVAAGAVMLASINSLIIGYFLFFKDINLLILELVSIIKNSPSEIIIGTCIIFIIITGGMAILLDNRTHFLSIIISSLSGIIFLHSLFYLKNLLFAAVLGLILFHMFFYLLKKIRKECTPVFKILWMINGVFLSLITIHLFE